MSDNILLQLSPLRNHVPQFDKIREEDFKPATLAAIAEARANIDAIINNPAPATFDNTIVALETASETLGSVTGIFYNQLSAAGTDGLQALAEEIGPVQANFGSDIILNEQLFARVKAVYDARGALSLNTEEQTLLDDTYKNFVRGGALLDETRKAERRKINEAMSILGPVFANNVKKSAESFTLWIENEPDLDGLPPTSIEGAKQEATEKGQPDKWLFTLDYPSFGPFMTFSARRDLREKIWKANSKKAYGDSYDNSANLLKIIELRHQRAQLLGYATHAEYVLERRMAEKPARVMEFLTELRDIYKVGVLKHLEALKSFAPADVIIDLKPENVMEAIINKKPIEQNRVFGVFPCPSGLYSFVNGGGIFRKSPNSNNWQPVSLPDGIHGISKIIEDDDSNLFMACQYGLYKSSDFGNDWTRVFTIGFANDVVIIDKTIYVTGINGIHCSNDGGNTWQQFTKLQEKIVVNKNQNISIFSHSNRLYVFIQTHDSLLPNTEVIELLYSDDQRW